MPANRFHFVEHWTIPGATPDEVWPIIADARLLPAWWQDVYLSAEPLHGAPRHTVGARYQVQARGFLPYKLNFVLESLELEPGRLVAVKAHGDFEGIWRATLSPQGTGTRVDIDWQVTVQKPLIRWLSPVLKPLFAANHNWTTPRGEAGLRRYLAAQP